MEEVENNKNVATLSPRPADRSFTKTNKTSPHGQEDIRSTTNATKAEIRASYNLHDLPLSATHDIMTNWKAQCYHSQVLSAMTHSTLACGSMLYCPGQQHHQLCVVVVVVVFREEELVWFSCSILSMYPLSLATEIETRPTSHEDSAPRDALEPVALAPTATVWADFGPHSIEHGSP
ncbi:hypothetical protein B7494_g4974 [Chlorociboria aeruginascens]|nr:hypothetical protein B7494_g4974 [Chlorociboria aeruginascens]